VFGVDAPKIKEDILSVLSVYRRKIFFINPYLEEQTSSEGITLQKSQEARLSFPVLSVGIVETSGLNFNQHSPTTAGWPGNSTAQVIRNFPRKLHLLAELHGTKEVYYYCGFAIRWGRESYQVIYIESVTKGTLVAPQTDGAESRDTEELIALQFVPEGQEKTLGQMTTVEKQIHDPRLKALAEVLRELEKNGLHKD
jgi:inosine/xanthosine triphosphate pyrophosphatase family protein